MKGRRKMQTPTHTVAHPLPPSQNGSKRTRPVDDVAYQVVTLAAILLVLGTLWAF
jgi:hypothetical protein